MRLITKEVDYAIRAVMHLARKPGTFVSSAEISAQEHIPLQFLRRILQRLLKAGLVTSREGVAGGVSLTLKPEKVRVLDVMKVFQGEVELSECMFRKRICANRGTCVLRERIKEIERTVTSQFAGITIADLQGNPRGQASRPASAKRVVKRRDGTTKKRGAR